MNSLVQIAKFRKNGLKFIPTGQGEKYDLPIELTVLFEQNEKNGFRVFAIDLVHVPHLTEEMAALFIETTARLRRRGGDLLIFNLHSNLEEDLALFNPQAYLSIARSVSAPPEFEPKEAEQVEKKVESPVTSLKTAVSSGLHKEISEMEISFREDQVYKACDFVIEEAESMGFPESEISRIKIAVYEACLNAVQHSNKAGNDENMLVQVEKMGDMMQINVYDRGHGFHVDNTQDYDVTEAASHRKTGGMGLHIIRKAMDKVDYQMNPISGNKLMMIKYLKK
jgi:serine/threonine-protein kinase RsbW